jgi:hypothetical protein
MKNYCHLHQSRFPNQHHQHQQLHFEQMCQLIAKQMLERHLRHRRQRYYIRHHHRHLQQLAHRKSMQQLE